MKPRIGTAVFLAVAVTLPAAADENHGPAQGMGGDMAEHMQQMMAPGLTLSGMGAAEGRRLFADQGRVVCHSISSVGG